jgi:hypothetical protein
MPNFPTSKSLDMLALDATGSTAWISTIAPTGNLVTNGTDLAQMHIPPAQVVAVWTLATGTKIASFDSTNPWSAWPLSSGVNSPLLLANGSTLGLVSSHQGEPSPAIRLATQNRDPITIAELCTLLAEPNQGSTSNAVPSGAYQGNLCP